MAIDKTPINIQHFTTVPTINDFAEFFMSNYVLPRNKASEIDKKRQILENFIIPIFNGIRLDEIESMHIDEFVARMRAAKASAKTVNNRLAVLAKMLRYAHARRLIPKVPTIDMMKVVQREIRFLTIPEIQRLLESASECEPVIHAMILVGLHTGMRIGELRALKWVDFDFKRGTVRISRSMYGRTEQTPKTRNGIRTIETNQTIVTAVHQIKRLGPLVFSRPPNGELLSYWAAKDALHKIVKSAGLKNVGWHTLRHTFASHLVMAGQPLRVVQGLLGHSTIQMTMRYSHLAPESRTTAVNVLVDLFKP